MGTVKIAISQAQTSLKVKKTLNKYYTPKL